MYKKILNTGGEKDINMNDFFTQSNSQTEVLKGIIKAFSEGASSIINGKVSGCSYVTSGGSHTIAAGFVYYNNEIYTVPAQTVSDSSAASLYYFLPSINNVRNKTYNDSTVKPSYQYYTGSWQLADISSGIKLSDSNIVVKNLRNRGEITMWSGAIVDIPYGKALCDGTNGTPDLRDKFIVGAGSTYTVGGTGGANEVTLDIAQMPSHTHTYVPGGAHGYYRALGSEPPYLGAYEEVTTTTATGGDLSHENRPPYYALAYIMQL